MGACQVCNGLIEISILCPTCQVVLEDMGRVMDYYDDYSAYMEIDQLKLEDGFPTTYRNETCPHFYRCASCSHEEVRIHHEKTVESPSDGSTV